MLLLSAALLLAPPDAPVPSTSLPASPPSAVPSTGPATPVPSTSPRTSAPTPVPSTSPPPASATTGSDGPPPPFPAENRLPPPTPPLPERPPEPDPDEFKRGRLKDRALPTVRAGFGGAFAPRPAPATGTSGGFAFDITLGASIQVASRVFLWPELGYSLAVRDQRTGHFMIAGLTPMFGTRNAQIGLAPRLVAGDAWGAAGVGVRTGLVASVLFNILIVEGGHQWLRAGDRDLHDGRFMISVDLVPWTVAIAVLRGFARFARKL